MENDDSFYTIDMETPGGWVTLFTTPEKIAATEKFTDLVSTTSTRIRLNSPDFARVTDEKITAITDYQGGKNYQSEAGFKIITNKQEIILAIDDESSCCETWGYFLTEDNISKFVGSTFLGVRVTDTNRSSRVFNHGYDSYDSNGICLDAGDVMFVDIETNVGILQFVAYNAHNGYYGHNARISSRDLTFSQCL